MTFEDYIAKLAGIRVSTARRLYAVINPLKAAELSVQTFQKLVASLFLVTSDSRWEAAEAARDFYDAEREHAGLPRMDTWLANYDPSRFGPVVKPHQAHLMAPDTPNERVAGVVGDVLREVDNAARETILEAVENDPDCWWARVEGGGDGSCPWCLMLISRGPVYNNADAAGDSFDFHRFCNCEVVPVFDPDGDWPGKEQYEKAEALWKKGGGSLDGLKEVMSGG